MNDVVESTSEEPRELKVIATDTSALVLDRESMDSMLRIADLMASGRSTVPAHLQKNPADCMAVVMQSMQWGMNPFAVAQKTHIGNGQLGYEAQLVNAVLQSSNSIDGRFHYEYNGDGANMECRVGAVIHGEKDITWGLWLASSAVTTKNSPLWKTNPKQQIGYLQVKNWARLFCPGAILGVYTPDEFEQSTQATAQSRNMGAAEVIAPEAPQVLIDQAAAAAIAGVASYQKFWTDTGKENRLLLGAHHEEFKKAAVKADKDRTIDQPAATESDADFVAAMGAAQS